MIQVEEVLPCLCETNDNSFVEYLNNDSSEILYSFIPNAFVLEGGTYNDDFRLILSYVSYSDSVWIYIPYNLFIDGNQVVFDDSINGNTK